jgi:two-component system response regulator PhcR
MPDARRILFVDDEATSRKWFARAFGAEFDIATAGSGPEALALLEAPEARFAVVVTDYRMPGMDGLQLLRQVHQAHRHLVRLLVTAYAEKQVAIDALNQGRVLRLLEKPLEDGPTREALREALATYRAQALERALNEGRVSALRETLGFLAHELNTPLATVRGVVSTIAGRLRPAGPGLPPGMALVEEHHPGELLEALERAERRALYCQSLVSSFVQSARDAYPGRAAQAVSASSLLQALLDEFPFEQDERCWVVAQVHQDFRLTGRRDLLYLVLTTLAKNALQVLRGHPQPRLVVEAGCDASLPAAGGWIRFSDNGRGIAPALLERLTREPVPSSRGGNGMGLLFCQRVLQDAGGRVEVASQEGQGTCVTLRFERGVEPVPLA